MYPLALSAPLRAVPRCYISPPAYVYPVQSIRHCPFVPRLLLYLPEKKGEGVGLVMAVKERLPAERDKGVTVWTPDPRNEF